MISVVISTHNDERTLGDVMGALVAAAVDALVREVIVVDAGSSDQTLEIADDAGARIIKSAGPEGIAQGCALAKGDWLLILDAKTTPPLGWENAVLDHVRSHSGEAGWWTAKPGRWPFGAKGPKTVLIPRSLYAAGSGAPVGRRIRFAR